MATAASTAATVALTSRWDNATGSPTVSEGDGVGGDGQGGPPAATPAVLTRAGPQAEPDPILDNSVLLVVVMSLFVGGTLVVLSGVLLLCKRCWEAHRRFNRCAAHPPRGLPAARAGLEPGDRASAGQDAHVRTRACACSRRCVSLYGVGGLLLSAWGARCVWTGAGPVRSGPGRWALRPTLLSCRPSPEPRRKQRRPPPPTWTMALTQPKVRRPARPAPCPSARPPARPLGPPDRLCLSVSPTRLGAARFRLISVSLEPARRCSQARAERVSV